MTTRESSLTAGEPLLTSWRGLQVYLTPTLRLRMPKYMHLMAGIHQRLTGSHGSEYQTSFMEMMTPLTNYFEISSAQTCRLTL